MSGEKTPLGIKLISIIYFACAIFLLVFSIMLFVKFDFLRDMPDLFPFLQALSSGLSIGITLIVISLLFLVVGIGLLRKKNWARIASLVLTLIGLAGSIMNVISQRWLSLINLVVYLLIGYYLIYNKKVRENFN